MFSCSQLACCTCGQCIPSPNLDFKFVKNFKLNLKCREHLRRGGIPWRYFGDGPENFRLHNPRGLASWSLGSKNLTNKMARIKSAARRTKRKRVPRHNFYDPQWRGVHPVPVAGVTSSFVVGTHRIRSQITTSTSHMKGMVYQFCGGISRILIIDYGTPGGVYTLGPDHSPPPVDIRALCASLRLTNITKADSKEGQVAVLVTGESLPLHITTQGALSGADLLEAAVMQNSKAKIYGSSWFSTTRKFVSGPGPQTEYKQYVPYNGATDPAVKASILLESMQHPHVESIVLLFPPTNTVNTYAWVLDEQTAQRHTPGTTLNMMQRTPAEHAQSDPSSSMQT